MTDLNHLNVLFTLIQMFIFSPSISHQYLAIRHEGNSSSTHVSRANERTKFLSHINSINEKQ